MIATVEYLTFRECTLILIFLKFDLF